MFTFDAKTGLLNHHLFIPSPNCDARPIGTEISLIVIHGISLPPGQFEGEAIQNLFTNRLDPKAHPYFKEVAHLKVSAHVLIRRQGQVIQFVPFTQRAWHAGQSCYQGREQCNDYSIGIELEGTDTVPYEDVQYIKLAGLIHSLRLKYPAITLEQIVGHCDVAPGRKTDPGPVFNWKYLQQLL